MPTINFRMDEEQHAELQAAARAAGRSLQAELSWRAFAHYPATRGADLFGGGLVEVDVATGTAVWPPRPLTPAGLEAGVDESADRSGRESGAGETIGGDSGGVRPTASQSAPASSPVTVTGLEDKDADQVVVHLERDAPAPSVPPAPVAARSQRLRRPKNGPCPHRVPEGTYCKQCGA